MNFKSKCFLILFCLSGLNLNAMHTNRGYCFFRTVINNVARKIKNQNWNRSFSNSANTVNQAKPKWTTGEKLAAAALFCYASGSAFSFYQMEQNTNAVKKKEFERKEQIKQDKLEYQQLLKTIAPKLPKIIKIRQYQYIIGIDYDSKEKYDNFSSYDFPPFKISVLDDNDNEVANMTYGIYPNCWISGIHIDPEFRKQGIGTNLLKLAIHEIYAIKGKEDIKFEVYERCRCYETVDFYLNRGAKIIYAEDWGTIMHYSMIFPKDINIDKSFATSVTN